MQIEKHSNDVSGSPDNSQDLSKLFDYPSVGELFSENDSRRFDEFCRKLNATRAELERVVRYASREEAARATRAVRAVETTLEFLQNLQRLRRNSQK
jgi:hypothetical protein